MRISREHSGVGGWVDVCAQAACRCADVQSGTCGCGKEGCFEDAVAWAAQRYSISLRPKPISASARSSNRWRARIACRRCRSAAKECVSRAARAPSDSTNERTALRQNALTTRLRSRRARRRNSLDNGRNAEVSKSGTTGLLRMQVLEHDVIALRARQRLRPFSGHRSEFDVSEATRKAHGEGRRAAAGAQVRGNGSCRNACCTRDGGCSDSRSARPGRGRSHGDNRHNGGGNCADDSDADHTVTEPTVGIEMAPRVARNSRVRGCGLG